MFEVCLHCFYLDYTFSAVDLILVGWGMIGLFGKFGEL